VNVNLQLRPFVRLQIGIGLVDEGPVSAQLLPAEIWRGRILHRVVALCLVVLAGVSGSQIEELVVRSVITPTEGNAGEARPSDAWWPDQLGCDVYFDRSIAKLRAIEERKRGLIHRLFGKTNGFAASILDGFRLHSWRCLQIFGV
jgi:hypothetical protein